MRTFTCPHCGLTFGPPSSPGRYRDITPDFLEAVAAVYRSNVEHAPTAAVGHAFGVKQRMASRYVKRARESGFLPPTTQGRTVT